MTKFKLFPKRKSCLNQSTNIVITTVNTSPLQDSILLSYSNVNSNPNDYPLNSQSVIEENESLDKIYSKTIFFNLPFL